MFKSVGPKIKKFESYCVKICVQISPLYKVLFLKDKFNFSIKGKMPSVPQKECVFILDFRR